jgi:hypothetical protein
MHTRYRYSAALAAPLLLVLTACGQTQEDFESSATTALVDVCVSEALPGLKTHLLADWTEEQINAETRSASDAAQAAFQKLEWTHGVTQPEFNENMDAARGQGRVLMLQVSVNTYPDSFSETVAQITESCRPQAEALMGAVRLKLTF